MIEIQLRKTFDPNNKVEKTSSACATLQGILKEETSVLDPVITVDVSSASWETETNIFTPNYAYIPDFGRYYFVKDIKQKSNDLFEVSLHVDVLHSYASGILSAPCIVAKNQNNFNLYLNDPNYKCFQNDYVLITKGSGGFPIQNSCFVLTIFGDKEYAS